MDYGLLVTPKDEHSREDCGRKYIFGPGQTTSFTNCILGSSSYLSKLAETGQNPYNPYRWHPCCYYALVFSLVFSSLFNTSLSGSPSNPLELDVPEKQIYHLWAKKKKMPKLSALIFSNSQLEKKKIKEIVSLTLLLLLLRTLLGRLTVCV